MRYRSSKEAGRLVIEVQPNPACARSHQSAPPVRRRNGRKDRVRKRTLLKDRIASERKARIEQIAHAYASGTYTVDAHAIAGKMIDAALESAPTTESQEEAQEAGSKVTS